MQDGFNDLNVETLKTDHLQKNTDVQVLQVPLSKIVPNPYQPRKEFESEALSELADSIRQYGVSEYTTQQIAEIALIENLQRKDLHYLEEAEGYEKLVNTFHLTQESMAIRVGKKQSTIANKLRLLRLPVSVRNKLHDSKLTERHARVLLKLENEETQKAVLQKVLKGNLNVRQTEALVEKTLKENGKLDKKKPRIVIVNDVRIYLNSIRDIMETVKTSGIPASMEQDMDGDDVVVTLRIKNVKKRKDPKVIKLF